MILSLLRECHNNKDRIGVIHAALQNVVQLASWDVSDLSCLLTTVVDIALPSPSPSSSSSSLDVELSLLALRLINSLVSESYTVLESHHLFHHITQILDRMAYLFEHLSSHTEPKEAAIQCSHFLGSMLQLDDEATQSKIEKLFPKFVSLGLKYLESASNEFLGIYILQTCLSSKYFGTISNSTIAPLRVQCLQLLESAYLQADVAKLLAISLQQGTTELWLAHWKAFTDECFNCLVMLGIIDGPLLVTEPTIDLQAVKLRIGKLAGWSKAQLVSSLHAGLLYVLTHLLEVGNCNGYMAINIGSYISYNTSLLSYTINMSSSSSTYLIANKQHITPASLRLLLPTMKIQCLQLLSLLLRTFNGGLARYGSSLCKLIATALALHKDTDLPVLLAALDTFSLAMALFPSLILQVATHGVVSLVDLFHATTDTLLALSSSSSSFSVDFHGAILCSMNNLIVYIGYEISSETTKKIESKLCALLYALTKGIFPAQQYSNRKIHRSNAEIIRVTPQLQQRVLQLGLSFLLHCHKLGVYSAILPILKKCAEDSLGIIENRMMGMQILTVLDTVTMPVAIALPIHNVQALIQEAIHEARTTAGTGILTDEEPLQQNGDSFIDEVVQVDTEGEKDTKNLIRQEEKEDSPSTKRVKLTAAEVETNFEVRNKVANMFGSRATNSSAVNVEKSRVLVEDNSDDDSLPDIVM